jgi:UDP-N-acetylmuramate dehydrogenase
MTDLERLVSSGLVRRDVPLGPLTTYKAGGPARLFADIADHDQLTELISSGLPAANPILVLGRGSNLVVADSGFEGLALTLSGEFTEISIAGESVEAGAAAPLPRVARTAVDAGLTGLEFLVGVPGSIGGAVRQNAGCFGMEMADRLIAARVVDLVTGVERKATPRDLDLAYRHSNLAPHELVVSAHLRGERGDPGKSRELMKEITRWRREHQPGGTLNAGSVFKNPEGEAAGELIDRLGLKGTSVGSVSVSEKHANFFVARKDATAGDIYRLVTLVKDTVFERTGTKLEPEIQFVGFEE